jgi:hypothetical protein
MTKSEPAGPSTSIIKRLFAHSGNRCAFPRCKTSMVQGKTVVGRVCHIAAASPDGPRYDASQSPAQRHGYDNLILLCPTHHTVVDDDWETYTVDRLAKMKADHEAAAGTMPDAEAASGAQLLQTINQSGGIAANTIHNLHIHPPATTAPAQPLPVSAGMTFFGDGEALASEGFPGEQEFTFDTAHFIYLRLLAQSNQPRVGKSRVLEVFKQARVIPMAENWSATAALNRHGAIYYKAATSHDIAAFTQGFASGELWGMNNRVFELQQFRSAPRELAQEVQTVHAVVMEKLYVTTLQNYVSVAQKEFRLALPYTVELGIKGINGAHIIFPRQPAGYAAGPVYEEAFRRVYPLHEPTSEAITDLLRSYFNEFYEELVGRRRADMIAENFVTSYQLPPL